MRNKFFLVSSVVVIILAASAALLPPPFLPALYAVAVVLGLLILLGIHDTIQTKQTIRRNFPLLGRFRYLLESIRPEIQQYFVEKNTEGMPFSREER